MSCPAVHERNSRQPSRSGLMLLEWMILIPACVLGPAIYTTTRLHQGVSFPAMQSGLFIWGPVAVAALVMVLMTVRTHSRRLPLAAIALYGWGIVTSIVVIASQRPG